MDTINTREQRGSHSWEPGRLGGSRNHSVQKQHFSLGSHGKSSGGAKDPEIQEAHGKHSLLIGFADGLITFCLGLLFFSLPVFALGVTFQGISFEKQILFYVITLIILVAWTAKGVVNGEMRVRRTPLDIPLVFFLGVYVACTFFSIDRWHSLWGFFGDPSRGLMSVIGLVIIYYAILSHFNARRFSVMMGSLVVSNFLLVAWSLIQLLGIDIVPANLKGYLPLSLLGSISALSIFLGMLLPILMMLMLLVKSEKSKIRKIYASMVAAFLFLNVMLNIFVLLALYGFVSWVSIMVGVSVFLIFILARIVRPAENLTWVPSVVFFMICGVLMIGSNSLARIALPAEVTPSYQMSINIARESLKNAFLVGNGPASYAYAFSAYHPQESNLGTLYDLRLYQGKGILLESISTIGILGVIGLCIVVLSYIGTGIYMLSRNQEQNKMISLGLFAASLIGLVAAFTERMEGPIAIIVVIITSIATAAMLSESESRQRFLPLSLKASPKYALALAFIFMVVGAGVIFLFVFIGKTFVADVVAGGAVREKSVSEQGSISKLARAVTWNNKESRYFTRMGQEYLILANTEALKGEKERDISRIQNYLQIALRLAKQGRDMMPSDALAQETLAQTYENAAVYSPAEAMNLAEQAYQRGLELEPHNPMYMVKIGQIKIAQGTAKGTEQDVKSGTEEGLKWFQRAVEEKPNFPLGYYQVSFAKEVLSDVDGAIAAMEKALLYESANTGYKFNLARLHQIRSGDDDNKIAEALYKNILQGNDKDINSHFSLGMVYEKMKRMDEASGQYKKVLELLPQDQKEARVQIQKMIDNIARGVENTPETMKSGITSSSMTGNQPEGQESPALMQEGR